MKCENCGWEKWHKWTCNSKEYREYCDAWVKKRTEWEELKETLTQRTHVSGTAHDSWLCEKRNEQDTCGWWKITYIEKFGNQYEQNVLLPSVD